MKLTLPDLSERFMRNTFIGMFVFIVVANMGLCIWMLSGQNEPPPPPMGKPVDQWEVFVEALIIVESEGNPLAVGTKGDVGILQITPVYVAEVNRILGHKVFHLEHRTDSTLSRLMFDIYQNHHNPDKDIDKAIRLHNPKAGAWYSEKIRRQMKR